MSAATVLLLLEGTYPYVRGGVSSWVHQMIIGLADFNFELLFIGGAREHYGEMQYELPANVSGLHIHYLEDAWRLSKGMRRDGRRDKFAESEKYHEALRQAAELEEGVIEKLIQLVVADKPEISHRDFLFSRASWDNIVSCYERLCNDPNFLNYFWTVRSIHAPIFLLADVARTTPPPMLIHSISTGYAGLLGSMLRARTPSVPFILSEHGIYTKERKIDLSQADWIEDGVSQIEVGLTEDAGYIRRLWIRFYQQVGRMTYNAANPIVSLYEGNRARQIADGADADRTLVVPNGISLETYAGAMSKRPGVVPMVIGFVGRVVPIKDVKTFIRAMRTIVNAIPQAQGWIIGPTEEDTDYAAECTGLVESLDLHDAVKFLGFQDVPAMLPQMGLMVLTSISEAQPLVMLEAFAAGVPCVATDVGSCRELIEGGSAAGDAALGHAGVVTNIASPEETANACVDLLTDVEAWHAAQQAGLQRVTNFYTEQRMFDTYRNLYRELIEPNAASLTQANKWRA